MRGPGLWCGEDRVSAQDLAAALLHLDRAAARGDQLVHVTVAGDPRTIHDRAAGLDLALGLRGHRSVDVAVVDGVAVLTVPVPAPGAAPPD